MIVTEFHHLIRHGEKKIVSSRKTTQWVKFVSQFVILQNKY